MSVCVMYPIYKDFDDVIFNQFVLDLKNNRNRKLNIGRKIMCQKNFEFRSKLPKKLELGTKIYVYEPKKFHGCGKVVGEFTVGEIIDCSYPIGAYPFLPYFCKQVLGNKDFADKFKVALKTTMQNYQKGTAVEFALHDDLIKQIQETGGEYPDPYKMSLDDFRKKDLTKQVIGQCDEWVTKMRFYNDMLESNYKYALEIINPIKYNKPKELYEFEKLDGSVVLKGPQSFVYVRLTEETEKNNE